MKITHPALSCEQGAVWERLVLGSDEKREWSAMRRAGCSIGRGVLEDWLETGFSLEHHSVLVLCGKGHNGGDALLAAREIFGQVPSIRIRVLFTEGERTLRPLTARAWRELRESAGDLVGYETLPSDGEIDEWLEGRLGVICWAICLDGVLGMGFKPPVRSRLDGLLRWVNRKGRIVLRAAVDLPSGVGDRSAEEPFRADFTYMPGIFKLPSVVPALEGWTGRLRYIDLSFFDQHEPDGVAAVAGDNQDFERRVIQPAILRPLLGLRNPLAHKMAYGHLMLVGGSLTLPGAILMSVLAALRSGVGLVTAFVPQSLAASFAARVPEAMWVPCPETPDGGLAMETLGLFRERVSRASALVLGPGIGRGPETHCLAKEIIKETPGPILLDADGLTRDLIAAASVPERDGALVLTPHGGEFSRIAGMDFRRVGEPGLVEFARRRNVVVVLKGPPVTRITDGRVLWYALNGGPVLARGGSGDILSGLIGGLLAGSQSRGTLMETASRGVCWQGLAADALARERGVVAVSATDLIECLGGVLRDH